MIDKHGSKFQAQIETPFNLKTDPYLGSTIWIGTTQTNEQKPLLDSAVSGSLLSIEYRKHWRNWLQTPYSCIPTGSPHTAKNLLGGVNETWLILMIIKSGLSFSLYFKHHLLNCKYFCKLLLSLLHMILQWILMIWPEWNYKQILSPQINAKLLSAPRSEINKLRGNWKMTLSTTTIKLISPIISNSKLQKIDSLCDFFLFLISH